jgi:hypothetical protein
MFSRCRTSYCTIQHVPGNAVSLFYGGKCKEKRVGEAAAGETKKSNHVQRKLERV